jgi:hypothetical protein
MPARLSVILLLLVATPTFAQEMRLQTGPNAFQSAVQLQARVHFQISGMVAHVQLEQEFRNDSGDWAEAEYLFPLPDDAAVNRLELLIGERLIVGEIREKQAAREIYQKAKASGRKAGLVEQRRPNLFSSKIANPAYRLQRWRIQLALSHDADPALQGRRRCLAFPASCARHRRRADTAYYHYRRAGYGPAPGGNYRTLSCAGHDPAAAALQVGTGGWTGSHGPRF